jgi:uncharacterized SAM-dependent methyltransferase
MSPARRIDLLGPEELESLLASELRQGRLPDMFLYVGDGSERWLDLDASRDFTVARNLTRLLAENLPHLVRHLSDGASLVSIGVGSGRKERLLLAALAGRGCRGYLPVDVSGELVEAAMAAASDLEVETLGLVAMCEQLGRLQHYWDSPALLCLLGNNFCNYWPDQLLGALRSVMTGRDRLLLDCHVIDERPDAQRKWLAQTRRAYGSDHNARFNLGPLLMRGVEADCCDFSLEFVSCRTPVGRALRTRKRIHMLRDARVTVGGETIELPAGRDIQMGFTFKWSPRQVRALAQRHGLNVMFQALGDDRLLMLLASSDLEE